MYPRADDGSFLFLFLCLYILLFILVSMVILYNFHIYVYFCVFVSNMHEFLKYTKNGYQDWYTVHF